MALHCAGLTARGILAEASAARTGGEGLAKHCRASSSAGRLDAMLHVAQPELAIKSDRLKPNEAMKLLANYEKGLKGYTYLHLNGVKHTVPSPVATGV